MYNVRVGNRIVNLEQVTKIVQLRPPRTKTGIDIHLADGGLVAISDPKEAARFIAKVPIHQDADEDASEDSESELKLALERIVELDARSTNREGWKRDMVEAVQIAHDALESRDAA